MNFKISSPGMGLLRGKHHTDAERSPGVTPLFASRSSLLCRHMSLHCKYVILSLVFALLSHTQPYGPTYSTEADATFPRQWMWRLSLTIQTFSFFSVVHHRRLSWLSLERVPKPPLRPVLAENMLLVVRNVFLITHLRVALTAANFSGKC